MTRSQQVSLSASQEDYIEAIFQVVLMRHKVKPKDIAEVLHVAGASVTNALKALADKGLITYAPYGEITLTPQGELVAEDVYGRHQKLKSFLVKMLQIEEGEANDTACKMEHAIPTRIINKLVLLADFIEKCPRAGRLWVSGFEKNCASQGCLDNCRECTLSSLQRIDQRIKQQGSLG